MATYTDNYQLTLPGYADVADVADLNHNATIIDEIMHSSQISLADAYDSTQTYNAGDVVMYQYKMYKCITDGVTGTWDPTKWERTTAAETGGSSDPDYYGTASGDPASFADGAAAGLVKCETDLEPVQDLHGYEKPWPGGAGKNKLKVTATSTTESGVTITINSDGTIETTNTATATILLSLGSISTEGTYNIYGCPSGGSSATYELRASNTNGNFVQDFGSGSTNITVGSGETLTAYLIIRSGVNATGLTFKPMILLSTETATTFEPYSNICPISGHDNINITVMGKNLVNELHNGAIGADGGYSTTTRRVTNATSATSSKIKVEAGKYTASGDGLDYVTVLTKNDNGTIIDNFAGQWNALPFTFTITAAANLYFTCRKSDSTATINPEAVKVQIEKGETATEIGPYTKITGVPLGSTVYGGTLDAQTGKLVINKAVIYLGSLSWTRTTSYTNPLFYAAVTDKKESSTDAACEWYANGGLITGTTALNNMKNATFGCGNNSNYIYIRDDQYTSASDFSTATANVNFVYELETPQTMQLTPAQVASVLGQNYVSSDTGAVDVIYIKTAAPIIPNATGDSSGDLNSIGLGGKIFTIPKELPAPPAADGAYKLRVTVTDGAPTFSWVSDT